MKKEKSLLSNAVKFTAASVSQAFLFGVLVLAGRYLGASDFGKFSFALAFVFLFKPITDPGLHHYMTREIARNKDKTGEFMSQSTAWMLGVFPIVFGLVFVIVNLIHDNPTTLMAVYLITIASAIKNYKHVQRSALIAWEQLGRDAFSLAFERTLLFGVALWSLMSGYKLIALCWVFVGTRIVDLIVFQFILKASVGRFGISFDRKKIWAMVVASAPIGAYYITLYLLRYVDTVMISALRDDQEVGWYSAGQKIYQGLLAIPLVVGTVLMPRLSRFYKENTEEFHDLFVRGVKYVFILAVFIGFNGLLFSGVMVTGLFGNHYREAIVALNILLVGVAFGFGTNYLVTSLIAMDRQKMVLIISLGGLFLNVLFNSMLIPVWGYKGAALATISVELLFVVVMLIYIRRHGHAVPGWSTFGKTVLAFSIPTAITVYGITGASLLTRALIINGGFVTMVLMLKVFDQKEWNAVWSKLSYVRNRWNSLF